MPGFIVVVVTAIIAALLAIAYRLMCIWTNKRRDKAGIMEGFDHAYEDDLTDKKVCVSTPNLKRLLIICLEHAIPVYSLNTVQGSFPSCRQEMYVDLSLIDVFQNPKLFLSLDLTVTCVKCGIRS